MADWVEDYMDDWSHDLSCHDIGNSGGCGATCPVFLRGDCDEEETGLEQLGVSCIEDIGKKEIEDESFSAFDRAMEILNDTKSD